MTNIVCVLFTLIVIPLSLSMIFMERKSRRTTLFLVIGITLCLIASNINSLLLGYMKVSAFYYVTTISPIVEELLKALPVLYMIFLFWKAPKLEESMVVGLSVGVGFALFESIVMFCQDGMTGSLVWAVSRGIGAGLVHALCTGAFATACYFIRKHREGAHLLLGGVLSAAIIYHGMYNCMVQSTKLFYVGLILPIVTYFILAVIYFVRKASRSGEEKH